MEAGRLQKSRVNPRATNRVVGFTHFFQLIMKPALVRAWTRTSLDFKARASESAAPIARQSST